MSVVISAAVGAKNAAGTEAPNRQTDVLAIRKLLNAVGSDPPVPANGNCDAATIKAIEQFQSLFGRPDGRVDPGGTTLRRLNQVASPLSLKPISLAPISSGAYHVRLTADPPPEPYRLWLAFAANPAAKMFVEPEGHNRDLITKKNLPTLLFLIDKANLWGKAGQLKVFVTRGTRTISESAACSIRCPVKPYSGVLAPDAIGAEPGLVYSGVRDGRFFHMPAIDGVYYFSYGGKLETDNARRGLNCITFAGAVYGVPANTNAMSAWGTQLADYLGAVRCDMEAKKEKDIKAFFEKSPTGNYIMWQENHVVLVCDAVVHEFSEGHGGYRSMNVQEWPFGKITYWIRRIDKEFGSCEPGVTAITARPAGATPPNPAAAPRVKAIAH